MARTRASGESLSRTKSSVVALKGKVRAGMRYTLTTTLPVSARTRAKVITTIVLR